MHPSLSRFAIAIAFPMLFTAMSAHADDAALPIVQEELVAPPQVPVPITRKTPARVVVNLTIEEVEREIAENTRYTFWTFGGTVPGKMIRVREGDTVELHLRNLSGNKLPHNIDLQAVSGPGGGAAQTLVSPGHESAFSFKALHAGLYVYHCAVAPMVMHVGNGMYGMILVEPKEGLPAVDHEYYVMQGDFYALGGFRSGGLQHFDMQKAIDEHPTYVLFNGADKSLSGKRALTAKTGDTVRIFFGDGGPNLTSSFHIMGSIFDKVYSDDGRHFQENVQTVMVPAGGSAMVELTPLVPGNLSLVDHSLTRATYKGAIGTLTVSGPDRPDIFGQGVVTTLPGAPAIAATSPDTSANLGHQVYDRVCAACHQSNGSGVAEVFPPLRRSDYFKAHPGEAARIIMGGRAGIIAVKNNMYNSVMPPQDLTDEEVAAVVNFISTEFNGGKTVLTVEDVRALRGTPAP